MVEKFLNCISCSEFSKCKRKFRPNKIPFITKTEMKGDDIIFHVKECTNPIEPADEQ